MAVISRLQGNKILHPQQRELSRTPRHRLPDGQDASFLVGEKIRRLAVEAIELIR